MHEKGINYVRSFEKDEQDNFDLIVITSKGYKTFEYFQAGVKALLLHDLWGKLIGSFVVKVKVIVPIHIHNNLI